MGWHRRCFSHRANMADTDNEQKTEQATEQRLNEAAERGQVAKAPELSVLVIMAAVLAVIAFTAQSSSRTVAEYAVNCFTNFATIQLNPDTVLTQAGTLLIVIAKVLVPVLFATVSAALLTGGIQTGFKLSPKVIELNFDKLNPMEGYTKII